MKTKIEFKNQLWILSNPLLALPAALLLFGGTIIQILAAPVTWSVNGHEYAFVSAPSISWANANAAVPQGWHLATLTSATENQWVYDNVVVSNTTKQAWLGASAPANRTSPGSGWAWVTGETWAYTLWASGEPNNSSGVETGLTINRYGTSAWNDEGCCLDGIGGYVIEMDPFSAAPPIITMPPQTQTAETGTTPCFVVEVTNASLTTTYQWYFSVTNALPSVSNAFLELPNVQIAQSGIYSVIVTNAFGAVTSSPAMLNVIAAVEHRKVPGLKMTCEPASLLNVDYANALRPAPVWTPLGSVSLISTSQFYFDLTAPLPPQRFYRAWQSGTPAVLPSLNLNFVPAITLTGNVSSKVRVDGINQFGSIDAWFTLDTVTLTNTAQLYFDVSVIGQPQRLYRLNPVP